MNKKIMTIEITANDDGGLGVEGEFYDKEMPAGEVLGVLTSTVQAVLELGANIAGAHGMDREEAIAKMLGFKHEEHTPKETHDE